MKKTLSFFDTRDSEDGFVGARILESEIKFFFPLGVDFNPEDVETCKKKAFNVLSVISTAAPSAGTDAFSQDFKGADKNPFNSFLWILDDFEKNGLYNIKNKTLVSGYDGKINWKRTFDTTPLTMNDEFVYLYPMAERVSSVETVISIIHKYCVDLSVEKVGWMFNLETDEPLVQISDIEKTYYKSVLEKTLRKTFDDRRKLLLTHLLRIINNSIGEVRFNDRSELGTYKFSRVWEYMIQKVYGNLPLDEFFPRGEWHLVGSEPFKSSELRPDTVLEHNNILYILDAKYYKYGVSANGAEGLPASESIQKQITYGDHAALKFSDKFSGGIKNAFVVPFCKSNAEPVVYAGYAVADWRETERTDDLEYRKIHLLLLDTEYLMQKYADGINDIETTSELVSKILN